MGTTVSKNVKEKIADGLLTGYFTRTTIKKQPVLVFNTEEYKKLTGKKEPTLGEISNFLELSEGSLRVFNNYRIASGDYRGSNLNQYTPSQVTTNWFFNGDVNIPIDSLSRCHK